MSTGNSGKGGPSVRKLRASMIPSSYMSSNLIMTKSPKLKKRPDYVKDPLENILRSTHKRSEFLFMIPSGIPTSDPSSNPSINQSSNPSCNPSSNPSSNPSINPFRNPSSNPSSNQIAIGTITYSATSINVGIPEYRTVWVLALCDAGFDHVGTLTGWAILYECAVYWPWMLNAKKKPSLIISPSQVNSGGHILGPVCLSACVYFCYLSACLPVCLIN